MKCPLVWYQDYEQGKPSGFRYGDYLKEECAWWIAGDKRCAILVAAAHLVGLVAIGDEIIKKMPHELQFRK